jgi:hypothetical protein
MRLQRDHFIQKKLTYFTVELSSYKNKLVDILTILSSSIRVSFFTTTVIYDRNPLFLPHFW